MLSASSGDPVSCYTTAGVWVGEAQVKAGFAKDSAVSSRPTFFLALCRK